MTTPTREQVMPEPFGYVSDWFGGPGMRFQRKPWPELHQLTHSVAAVYSAAQLLRAIEYAHTAGREQGLREAKEVCDDHKARWSENANGCSSGMYDFMSDAAEQCAAAIEQLRA